MAGLNGRSGCLTSMVARNIIGASCLPVILRAHAAINVLAPMKKFFSTVASGLIGWYICGGIPSSPNLLAATDAAVAQAAPKIKFATNFFDFGKITATETIAGEFEFTNVGNGILKVEPPESSCDCTTPIVKPDALAPGETGKIIYAIKLD